MFYTRGSGYGLFLTPTEAVLSLWQPSSAARKNTFSGDFLESDVRDVTSTVISIRTIGANPYAQMIGARELPGTSNYFIGNDPSRWITNVPTYDAVRCRDMYPGIDLVYHGVQHQLEYDFIVAPGVDPRAITLGFDGASKLAITATGELLIKLLPVTSSSANRSFIRRPRWQSRS
jgi:hypothetical protein